MHWEHVFGSSCFLWNISLSDLLGIYHLFSRKPSRWLIWQVFLRPAPGKDLILVSLCFSPQCFSEEDVRVSLVLFSKYAHLSFEKKTFLPLNAGKCFFFSCFDKVGFTVSYPSLNGTFKRRLILKLLKWHLITFLLTATFFFCFSFIWKLTGT